MTDQIRDGPYLPGVKAETLEEDIGIRNAGSTIQQSERQKKISSSIKRLKDSATFL